MTDSPRRDRLGGYDVRSDMTGDGEQVGFDGL